MKNLILKEIKLVVTPSTYVFALLSLMLLIPAYPCWVGVFYCFIAVQITFQMARANKDNEFSAMLPIPRKHIVLAKHFTLAYIELMQLVVAIPAAVVALLVLTPSGNIVGMDANMAFFGMVLIGYAVFNFVFMSIYFRSGYKSGLALVLGMLSFAFCVMVFELLVNLIPALKVSLDGRNGQYIGYRALVLALGIIGYVVGMYVSYRVSVKKFERVNL